MSSQLPTASQTVGPFFHDCLVRPDARRSVLTTAATEGEHIRVVGRVVDGDHAAVPDAMVEIWQANHHGRYQHPTDQRPLPLDPTFTGFGRCETDAEGYYCFDTIKPGRVPFDETQQQAPHICVAIFGRGLLNHVYTRLYFADDPANADDPVLLCVPLERRATMLAKRQSVAGSTEYRFDIVLQGTDETVFFNL